MLYILFRHLFLDMNKEMVNEIVEFRIILTWCPIWMSRKWYLEFTCSTEFYSIECYLYTYNIYFFGLSFDVCIEFSWYIFLYFISDKLRFIMEFTRMNNIFSIHKLKRLKIKRLKKNMSLSFWRRRNLYK